LDVNKIDWFSSLLVYVHYHLVRWHFGWSTLNRNVMSFSEQKYCHTN